MTLIALFLCCNSPFLPLVPGAPPQDVRGTTLSSTSLLIEWQSPPEGRQNGDITSYKVNYLKIPRNDEDVETQTPMMLEVGPGDRSCVLKNLDKWTLYEITMLATTVVGDGPASMPINVQTDEDGMYGFVLSVKGSYTSVLLPKQPLVINIILIILLLCHSVHQLGMHKIVWSPYSLFARWVLYVQMLLTHERTMGCALTVTTSSLKSKCVPNGNLL